VLTGNVAEQVDELKQQPGDPIIVIGSAKLAQTLVAHDLVDEYQLWLHPIVLGSGKRLFNHRDRDSLNLQLVDSTVTAGGLVILTYQRAGDIGSPHRAASGINAGSAAGHVHPAI
jgi:dihydrofolate reductase